ncbi:MAG: DUF1460 domain-containing protein [Anaeromyxobacter sp.]|nr:DUF1460 domain-containing protein [Anaeromyxobacter sp.]MBL0277071.1 DUF1460 domain-containing protein [Anaeromyxobacter sp.]
MSTPLLTLALAAALALAAPAGASPAAPAAPEPPAAAPPSVEEAVAAALAARPPAGGPRAVAATAPLLGARYEGSPLGEGAGPDPDPRFRLDAFDCLTFAETALALGSSATLAEARRALDDLRYADGRPTQAGRNHEVLSQWLPANLAKGWLAPASRAVAGDLTVVAEVRYDPARWSRLAAAGHRLPGVPRARLPEGRFEVEVVPVAALAAAARRLEAGTLAFVVRQDRDDFVTRVSHVGLVVVRRGQRLVRHASRRPSLQLVVEEPLERFVARQQLGSPRPLTGLALFTLRDASARVRSLPAR